MLLKIGVRKSDSVAKTQFLNKSISFVVFVRNLKELNQRLTEDSQVCI